MNKEHFINMIKANGQMQLDDVIARYSFDERDFISLRNLFHNSPLLLIYTDHIDPSPLLILWAKQRGDFQFMRFLIGMCTSFELEDSTSLIQYFRSPAAVNELIKRGSMYSANDRKISKVAQLKEKYLQRSFSEKFGIPKELLSKIVSYLELPNEKLDLYITNFLPIDDTDSDSTISYIDYPDEEFYEHYPEEELNEEMFNQE